MRFTRYLCYRLPLLKGEDVLYIQRQLLNRGYHDVGEADGKFGQATRQGVLFFQRDYDLLVDGIVGPQTWQALFETIDPDERLLRVVPELKKYHRFRDGVEWRLQTEGVNLKGDSPARTRGEPITVSRVWNDYGDLIVRWSGEYHVPCELILATICTESSGKLPAIRTEPGYTSDQQTPHRVSIGLMQTLISTARETLQNRDIDRNWLEEPDNSIKAGTAYIAQQFDHTDFDPPKVACAYNAGGIYHNSGAENRWKMRQFPIGTSDHADRFVEWYNDFCAIQKDIENMPRCSFANYL